MERGGKEGARDPAKVREALLWSSQLRDGLGRGLDTLMIKPVAVMRLLGVETYGSCQGHRDHGTPYPWIDTGASREQRANLQIKGFHFVPKGYGQEVSWRLVPVAVSSIADQSGGVWEQEISELAAWSELILSG
jgi:hypothetical protein